MTTKNPDHLEDGIVECGHREYARTERCAEMTCGNYVHKGMEYTSPQWRAFLAGYTVHLGREPTAIERDAIRQHYRHWRRT